MALCHRCKCIPFVDKADGILMFNGNRWCEPCFRKEFIDAVGKKDDTEMALSDEELQELLEILNRPI